MPDNPGLCNVKGAVLFASTRLLGYAVFGLAALLGPGSLAVFAWFLFAGSLDLVNLEVSEARKLWIDAFLCLAFFIQHSSMLRKSFRKRLVRVFPEAYSGAFYTIVSSIVLLLLIVFWQKSAYAAPMPHNLVRWFSAYPIFFL